MKNYFIIDFLENGEQIMFQRKFQDLTDAENFVREMKQFLNSSSFIENEPTYPYIWELSEEMTAENLINGILNI